MNTYAYRSIHKPTMTISLMADYCANNEQGIQSINEWFSDGVPGDQHS